MKKTNDILKFFGISTKSCFDNGVVSDVFCRSSLCSFDSVFVAIHGAKHDGHDFIGDAYSRGCRIFVVENPDNVPFDAIAITVSDSRRTLSSLASFVYDYPQCKLKLIGVTGTKGKSTVSSMICKVLNDCGKNAALVGTLGFAMNGENVETLNSTPESDALIRFINEMVKNNIEYAIVEVSSQGIKQNRVADLIFDVCVMTNLSFDHIGNNEHADFEEYKNYKKSLFLQAKTGILNADDKYFDEFSLNCKTFSYGIKNNADLTADDICNIDVGDDFGVKFVAFRAEEEISCKVSVPMPGMFSVYNSLAAIATCNALGISINKCAASLRTFKIIGRFEKVISFDNIDVIIDYAHNKDSLENALCAVREFCKGRIICVFGAVGEHSEIRRAGLGYAADRYADVCIITSDNPNFEDQKSIADSISANITHRPYVLIDDRKKAIEYAIDIARSGDAILIAGKGHERYQLIKGLKIPFDEKEIVLQKIECMPKNKI